MIWTEFNYSKIKEYKKIIHCHIFKSAGTYLDHYIKNLGNYYEFNADEDLQIRKKNFELLKINENYILSSHAVPLLSELYKNYLWFLIMRDPIERIKSAYMYERFIQPYGQTPGSTKSKDLCINKFFEWRLTSTNVAYKNIYIRTILNIKNDKLDEESILQAKNKLELDNVIYCNIKDVSNLVFKIMSNNNINIKNFEKKINTSVDDSKKEKIFKELDKDIFKLIIEKNYYDLKLYKQLSKN